MQNNHIAEIVDLEQKIVSGLQNKLNVDAISDLKISNTDLVRSISSMSKNLEARDYLRVIMIYFACFDLAPKDKNTLLKSF